MLVLSRLVGEDIVIVCPDGTEIAVRVSYVKKGNNGRVGIAFDAPKSYRIHRKEILDEIKAARNGGAA